MTALLMTSPSAATGERNPWLDIPAAEYQAHMQAPEVAQHAVLAELFELSLRSAAPRRLMVLGCGTGNGFAHIDPAVTREVVAVDINPAYLGELAAREPAPAYERTLVTADLTAAPLPRGSGEGGFDLIHAPFLFEFLPWRPLLADIAAALCPGGAFSIVIQRESRTVNARTPTPYFTLRRLDALFAYVDPLELGALAGEVGLLLASQRDVMLPRQKSFTLLTFRAR